MRWATYLLGRLWDRQRKSVRKEPEQEITLSAALYLELVGVQLGAGLSVHEALVHVGKVNGGQHEVFIAAVLNRLKAGGSWSQAWQAEKTPPELIGVRDTLGFMLETGAPTAALLEVMAARERRMGYRRVEKSAAKLGVKLVVPLGLCSLPAFICLGVIPVLISMVPAVSF